MNWNLSHPVVLVAAVLALISTGATLTADAQITGESKTECATVPVQAHITVTADPGVKQVEKAHEKSQIPTDPLSRVQLERLAANARIYKEKVSPLQAELRLDKRRLMDVLTDESGSVPHAQLLQAKIGLLKADIRDLQLKKQLADSRIMTPGR